MAKREFNRKLLGIPGGTPRKETSDAPSVSRHCGDRRFQELCALAGDGCAEAAADLFREFHFNFGEDRP